MVIFVVATTGQGDEAQSMRKIWRNFFLRSDLPPDLLQHLHYTVFGLGDSTYPKFNWPAKKLDRRLEALGAVCILDRGEADDQDYAGSALNLRSLFQSNYGLQRGHNSRSLVRGTVANTGNTSSASQTFAYHSRF